MGLRDRLRGRRTPEDAFADEVARLVATMLAVKKVERGEEFSLKFTIEGRSEPTWMFLQNIYAEARGLNGAVRAERLRRAVLAMSPADRPTTWADARPRLMPALRAVSWAASSARMGAAPLRREFVPFVELMVAVDDEYGMSFVTADDLEKWDVDEDAVIAVAMANLSQGGTGIGVQEGRPFADVLGPNGYVSSWLALPTALEHFATTLDDQVVAIATSRDSLRLHGTRDPIALANKLAEVEAEYLAAPRQLSPVPYEIHTDRVAPWEPPTDHPCHALVARLQRILAMREYGLQLDVMDDLFQKSGVDVHVAQYTLTERPDKSLFSWAVWLRQVTDALLPQTDYVLFGDDETNERVWVRWDDAQRIAGGAMGLEAECSPARWRVHGWPDDAIMTALRLSAVNPTTQ